jgi:transposase-like protein
MRWPDGVACPLECGSVAVAYMPKRRRWYCRDCKGQFTAITRTIFEDSPIGFDKWLPAIWLIASNRNGISSYEIHRGLGVTQKTAWFMLHRIRLAMQTGTYTKFTGPVEADETYIGGLARNMHIEKRRRLTGTGGIDKTAVMGIVERKGRVRAFVIPSTLGPTMEHKVREHVEKGATLYTDGLPSYAGLDKDYVHHVINHAHEYVRGHIHTNNIEGFWSVFKRTIKGTYIAPHPEHLQRYVEEQVFRFNARDNKDGPRFVQATQGADGKRLTYKALIGKQ